jgi:hypothetical protein
MKVLDLFSGIGGFSLGLERTGVLKQSHSVKLKNTPDVCLPNTGPTSPVTETSASSRQTDLLPMESSSAPSAAGSPARTSALQARVQASKGNDQDYGESTPDLLANYDPKSSSWRTSQLCLDGDFQEFSETWPRSGMMRNGTAYRLPPLVRLTAGTASGLWPTPRGCSAMAATITPESAWAEGRFPNLETVVGRRMWPTPNASDCRDRGNLSNPAIQRRVSLGKQLNLSMVVSPKSGALNPTWVEWLQGFPLGWTETD